MRGETWAVALLVVGGCAATSAAPPPAAPARPTLHPVLMAYVSTLDEWTTEAERDALGSVDLSDTLGGDAQRLRYLAADRVVRRLLPLALEAHADGRPELLAQAAMLRRLPPLLNRDTDAVAAPFVRDAIRALRGDAPAAGGRGDGAGAAYAPSGTAGAPDAELASRDEDALLVATEDEIDPELEASLAEALAEYADAYALARGATRIEADAAAAAAADTLDAGLLFRTAVAVWGVPRERALEVAEGLLSDMAGAARRRERIPYVPRAPEPPTDATRTLVP